MEGTIDELYFSWIVGLVCDGKNFTGRKYDSLLRTLHSKEFYWSLTMDENRNADGLSLRKEFARQNGLTKHSMQTLSLSESHASVLEMLAALSLRCETINCDDKYGNRTWVWFWKMLESSGLRDCPSEEIEDRVDMILNHEYLPNGKGGFFYAPHTERDMRKADLWYQLNYWLREFIDENPFNFEEN